MTNKQLSDLFCLSRRHAMMALLTVLLLLIAAGTRGSMLYKNYVVRYDRGWDILCDPYEVQKGDWVLKIFRQKGEIAHEDFREFLGIFKRLNPHVKDIDRLRPGQVVDIPLKKLVQGNLPGQSSGVVTIPFVQIGNPRKMVAKHTRAYTIQKGDTVSTLIAKKFGGRFGNLTYSQGLKLFKAVNPQVEDINRIYAGQRIYMPDPAIREMNWYNDLFDKTGNLVEAAPSAAETVTIAPVPKASAAVIAQRSEQPPDDQTGGPAAGAATAIDGRLMNKGTYFLPMKNGQEFELDLSQFPVIDLQNGEKVILTHTDHVMGVDLPLAQSYWEDVNVVQIPENASSQEILEAVLAGFAGDATTNRLAFDDNAASVSVSAKWIRSKPSANGRTIRHSCITPISSAAEQTQDTIVRYLDQNDIVIKELLNGEITNAAQPLQRDNPIKHAKSLDGSSPKTLVESFSRLMGFSYSPNTGISFPYAGVQIQAQSNLLSFGNGKEVLIDYGDLYGNAIEAIRRTGFEIIQFKNSSTPLEIIDRLMEASGLYYERSPVFYGADRPSEFNTIITVKGILVPKRSGANRMFIETPLPDLVGLFIQDQGIDLVRIEHIARK